MRQADIQVGMVLRLKKERAEDYGMSNPYIIVTGFKARKGYRVVLVQSGTAFFVPSDFAEFVRWADAEERTYRAEGDLQPIYG